MLGALPSSRPGAGLCPLNCGLRACGSRRRRGACATHTQIRLPRPRAPGARENASSAGGGNRAPYVHRCRVPERRQTECYSVSRVEQAPRVPRGCRAAAFRTVRECLFAFVCLKQRKKTLSSSWTTAIKKVKKGEKISLAKTDDAEYARETDLSRGEAREHAEAMTPAASIIRVSSAKRRSCRAACSPVGCIPCMKKKQQRQQMHKEKYTQDGR